ncbi:MAG: aminoacyl-tRNA hydrolase [Deltaproteobacteria bacterium HGW-Deltaproteobacteria-19]|jgi:PTH1 family peptidyl-tRNA hydrolase|nr:MAG: aminoacyl-tRNA hydrolase [Deltaproteobacteria bacterium HGW-Deltaproteobacteria-19]
MKLIVGLGNPGERYRFSRHNLGFLVIDELADREEITLSQKRFEAIYGKGSIGSSSTLLAKPQTYMNLSGLSVRRLFDFFKIDLENLIVIHDDLDLPFGTLRLKKGGGSGGHRGVISVMESLGEDNFIRVRMGIGKPPHKGMVEDYVLQLLPLEEAERLSEVVSEAAEAIGFLVATGLPAAMNRYNGKAMKNLKEEEV